MPFRGNDVQGEILSFSSARLPAPPFRRAEARRRAGPYAQPLASLLGQVVAGVQAGTLGDLDLDAIVAGIELEIADKVIAKAGRKTAPSPAIKCRWLVSGADLVGRIAWDMVEVLRGGVAARKNVEAARQAILAGERAGEKGRLLALILVDAVAKTELVRVTPPSPRGTPAVRQAARAMVTKAIALFVNERRAA